MRPFLIETPKTKYSIGRERMDIPDSKTVSFSMEYRELLRTLDNDESVRTFMDGKLNERGEMAQVSN